MWILLFSAVGLVLEGLHGLKAGLYLDVGNEPRRLMWILAHTHGTLFGLLHIAFAVTVPHLATTGFLTLMSRVLLVSGALLLAGFFLGGVVIHGGDPGLAVLLVPVGAVGLIVFSALVVTSMSSEP